MRLARPIVSLSLVLSLSACSTPEPDTPPGNAAAPSQAPAPVASPAAPGRLRVIGTEPFWGIDVEGDRLHFTTAEDQAGKHLAAAPVAEGDGLRYAGQGDDGIAFELRLSRGACSDGMSDRTYAYNATFRYGSTEYRGCADTAAALEAQPAP